MTIIDGRRIADEIKKDVKSKLDELKTIYGVTPTIASIIIGDNKESELYLKLRDKASSEVGIKSKHYRFSKGVSKEEIIKVISELNNNQDIHGILLQQPIPEHLSLYNLLSNINPLKDVEGLTPYNLGRLMMGYEKIIPCTPLAVLKILEYMDVKLEGSNIVIINHSIIVGKPLSILLLNRNATVTVCHVYTKNLKQYTLDADILITATGVPGLIKEDYIKKDACVIDVGITKTSEGIRGDVDFNGVKEKASMLTPVPGGVGPATIACSLMNMLETFQNCMELKK